MGYEELTNIENDSFDDTQLLELAQKRAISVQRLVDDFIKLYEEKYGHLAEPIDNIALKLSYAYLKLAYSKLKPLVDERINCYKMGSLMELLIVKEQVLNHPDSETNPHLNRELNALFGMTAAFSLINCMINKADKEFYFDTINNYVDREVEKVLKDHRCWLETKELNEMPIIINSQFFHLIEILHGAPYQINGY